MRSEGVAQISEVGVVSQRIVVLKGNAGLGVARTRAAQVSVPFRWQPNIWYTLKARVDLTPDGSGVVARTWKRALREETWTIGVPQDCIPRVRPFCLQPAGHAGFVDNVTVTPNWCRLPLKYLNP